MASRLELHEELKKILGNNNVYFQPPESLKMSYPAIRYGLRDITTINADNMVYTKKRRYSLILIHKNPDNDVVDKMVDYGMSLERTYVADGLNHYAFTFYY